MAEDWKTAYGRIKMELDEYKETIVPALMNKVRNLECRWIPVNVRKPPDFVNVLAYVPGLAPLPTVMEVYLAKGCWVTRTMILDEYEVTHWDEYEVTHWMELPEGPGKGAGRR